MKDKAKLKAAVQKLSDQLGVNVSSAYGYPESFDDKPQDFLIVFSDKKIKFPNPFEGYTVVRRGIPRAL